MTTDRKHRHASHHRNIALQIFKPDLKCGEVVLHALKLDAHIAVVALLVQNAQTLVDRHVAVTEDRTAQIVAAARAEKAASGIRFAAGLYVEVLDVYVPREGCDAGNRCYGRIVCTQEVIVGSAASNVL